MSKIEWLARVGTKPLPAKRVVPTNEFTRPAARIEPRESCSAPTGASNKRVRLAGDTVLVIPAAIPISMFGDRRDDLKVFGTIVGLVAVLMVNLFARAKRPAEHNLGNKPVLVHVAAHVGAWMLAHFHKHIAVGGDGSAAFPIGVSFAWMNNSHASE